MAHFMQKIVSIPVASATNLVAPKVVTVQSGGLCTLVESAMVFQLGNECEILTLYLWQTFFSFIKNADYCSTILFDTIKETFFLFLLQTGMPRFFVVPRGMEDIVRYVKERYHNKTMVITENGKIGALY